MKQIIQTLLLGCIALFGAMLPNPASAAPFAAFVMDARSGKEVYSRNGDARLHPASLTKMMTLYMAFAAVEQGKVRLDSRFTISSHAASQPPSRLGLRAGQKIELRYLIRAAAVKSANDAATAIGEGLAGSEPKFAAQMTAMARALGMQNTNFRNANGLTQDGHYSSARDMTTMGRRLFYDYPQYYNIFSRRSADAGIAKVASTNRRFLDSYQGADGIKTGYTRAAGFNLTASAQRGNKRIIATVMGGTSTAHRNATMAQLLDQGFGQVPSQVREIRPATPVLTVEKKRSVQIARAAPAAQVSAADRPAARASTMPPAAVAAAVAEAKAASAVSAAAQAKAPSSSAFQLTESARPKPRGNRGPATQVAAATDEAVALALSPTSKPTERPEAAPQGDQPGASASTAGLDGSQRPTAAPRDRKRAEASSSAAAAASTFVVAQAEFPALEEEPLEEGDRTDDSVALLTSDKPLPRTDTIILAAMDAPEAAPLAQEVVSRASSGKGNYGVSLGLFRSRSEAEQSLLKTALQERTALSSADSRVADTRRGFEANFVGLSKGAAELVCSKLQARQQDCVIVP